MKLPSGLGVGLKKAGGPMHQPEFRQAREQHFLLGVVMVTGHPVTQQECEAKWGPARGVSTLEVDQRLCEVALAKGACRWALWAGGRWASHLSR